MYQLLLYWSLLVCSEEASETWEDILLEQDRTKARVKSADSLLRENLSESTNETGGETRG